MHGYKDIASFTIVTSRLSDFQSEIHKEILIQNMLLQPCKNREAITKLQKHVPQADQFLEFPLINHATYQISVLFAISGKLEEHLANTFMKKVIIQSIEDLRGNQSSRQMSESTPQALQHVLIFESEWEIFSQCVDEYCKYFSRLPAANIHGIYFHWSVPGLKTDIEDALNSVCDKLKEGGLGIKLIQIRVACTINAPHNGCLVTSYEALEQVLGQDMFYCPQHNYFLREYGMFHGASSPKIFPSLVDVKAYATRDHLISDRSDRASQFLYTLFGNCKARNIEICRLRKSTERHMDELMAWLTDLTSDMGTRIEAVYSVSTLEALRALKWTDQWNFSEPLANPDVLDEFLNALANGKSFFLITNFKDYANDALSYELPLLQVLRTAAGINIPKPYYPMLYLYKEKVVTFIEGTLGRSDHKYLRQFIFSQPPERDDNLMTKYKRLSVLLDKRFFDDRQQLFSIVHKDGANYARLLYECALQCQPTGNLGDDLIVLQENEMIHELFKRLAVLRDYLVSGQMNEVANFSSFEVPADTDANISLYDVTTSIFKPRLLAVTLVVGHVFASAVPSEEQVRQFVRERVRRWPMHFVSETKNMAIWANVVVSNEDNQNRSSLEKVQEIEQEEVEITNLIGTLVERKRKLSEKKKEVAKQLKVLESLPLQQLVPISQETPMQKQPSVKPRQPKATQQQSTSAQLPMPQQSKPARPRQPESALQLLSPKPQQPPAAAVIQKPLQSKIITIRDSPPSRALPAIGLCPAQRSVQVPSIQQPSQRIPPLRLGGPRSAGRMFTHAECNLLKQMAVANWKGPKSVFWKNHQALPSRTVNGCRKKAALLIKSCTKHTLMTKYGLKEYAAESIIAQAKKIT